jgi:hypothetical protein
VRCDETTGEVDVALDSAQHAGCRLAGRDDAAGPLPHRHVGERSRHERLRCDGGNAGGQDLERIGTRACRPVQ